MSHYVSSQIATVICPTLKGPVPKQRRVRESMCTHTHAFALKRWYVAEREKVYANAPEYAHSFHPCGDPKAF